MFTKNTPIFDILRTFNKAVQCKQDINIEVAIQTEESGRSSHSTSQLTIPAVILQDY